MRGQGQKLIAPRGFKNLNADRTYFYVSRSKNKQLVTLCFFTEKPVSVQFERMREAEFEQGLEEKAIVIAEECSDYPPWVEPYVDTSTHYTGMSLKQRLLKQKVRLELRYYHIKPLLGRLEEISSSDNPLAIINAHAKTCSPQQHPARLRLWFFSYLCFGMSSTALLSNTWKNGRFDRDTSTPKRKYGPKCKRSGEFSGYAGSPVFTDKCIDGYEKFKNQKTFREMHEATIKEVFGCRVRNVDGKKECFHPEGEAFPSYRQFMSRVYKKYGFDVVQDRRYSESRRRRKDKAYRGKYTENRIDLMEQLEADGYFVDVELKTLDGESAPAMVVVRIIDGTSGMRLGIGCSLNGEKAEAYQMAAFCMGVPKDIFCSYFGIKIDREMWPSFGYPLEMVLDRGAGTKGELLEKLSEMISSIEMARSYSGQDKATVESSNPRKTKTEGRPKYRKSNLNYIEYFKHEILRLIKENHTADITGRMPLSMFEAGVKPRPIHVWNDLVRRLRISSVSYDFQRVAELFLEPKEFKVTSEGIRLDTALFRSDELKDSGLCNKVSGGKSFEIDGYMLYMSLRQIWICFKGKLIECHLVPPMKGNGDEANYTVKDLEDISQIRKNLVAETQDEDTAIALEIAQLFEESVGKSMFGESVHSKKSNKKTIASKNEIIMLNKLFARGR